MTVTRETMAVFNRGIVDDRGQARIDVRRVALSAEEQKNCLPRVLGSMALRPGMQYHGAKKDNAQAYHLPFQFTSDDEAILEMTPSVMRIWDDGDTLLTRASVSATIANGTFDSDLASWTDADETGAASDWATGGYMQLLGTSYTEARRRQSVSITETTTVHGLRVVIQRGPVYIRIGSSAGTDDIFTQSVLRTGTHSLAFDPDGNSTIHIELASSLTYPTLVDSVAIEASGTVELPTPWSTTDLCSKIRWDQVNDVIFAACDGVQQRRIERRENDSWSVCLYESNDGPYLGPNTEKIRLTPSALSGEITLTSSRNLFKTTTVGQLFRLYSQGQTVQADISSEASFSDEIRITGVGASRDIAVNVTGTWSGTVSLQRSIGAPGSWSTVATYIINTASGYNDGLDNTVAYYRIGIESGNYTSGTAECELISSAGSITGVVRVTAYSSATSVTAVVLRALGQTEATEEWEEGSWSDLNGYPTAVAFYEGRLWFFGRGRAWGSVVDDLVGFDPDTEGDSAPINRALGARGVDVANWTLALERLLVGTDNGVMSVRSSSLDEPITPNNFNIKVATTSGAATSVAAQINKRGYYIPRSLSRCEELDYDLQGVDYQATDMTALTPDLGILGFTRVATQQHPDPRIWLVRADGTAVVIVRDPIEDVLGVVTIETDGEIEDVTVLGGDVEDRVFFSVKRTIDGSTVRYHESLQRDDHCRGETLNRQADAALYYNGASATTITGLDHLEGETVVVWGNGKDLGSYTVSSGQITLSEAVTQAWIGLGYEGRYKSAKLAIARAVGLHIGAKGRIISVALVLRDTHAQGLEYGTSFDDLDTLPQVEDGAAINTDAVYAKYDEGPIEVASDWDEDARLCLKMTAPRPCTVSAAAILYESSDYGHGSGS